MDQIKIGKFIAKIRKEKKLTQKQLADKLGITDRAISKWENGKSLPDLSLLKPVCNILDISINELLSGEFIKIKDSGLENNIVSAINYSNKKRNVYELGFFFFILFFGILMVIISMSVFSTPIPFTTWYSMIGTYGLIVIFSTLLKKILMSQKSEKYVVILILCFFMTYLSFIWCLDYINVKKNNANPDVFVNYVSFNDNDILYDTWFYDVYICNVGAEQQSRKIKFNIKHKYDLDVFDKQCNK